MNQKLITLAATILCGLSLMSQVRAETAPPQVMIEVKIVEIQSSYDRDLGIDFDSFQRERLERGSYTVVTDPSGMEPPVTPHLFFSPPTALALPAAGHCNP